MKKMKKEVIRNKKYLGKKRRIKDKSDERKREMREERKIE